MVQEDEAAVYHRDKRLDAIWWVCAANLWRNRQPWPLIPLSRLEHGSIRNHAGRVELWVSWHPARGSGIRI